MLEKVKAGAKNKALLKKRELEEKAAKAMEFIAKKAKYIAGAASAIVHTIIAIQVAIFVISILAAFGSTPHYYCDKSQKEVSADVYNQYCNLSSGNANNESIVQACNSIATTDTSLGTSIIKYSTRGTGDMTPYVGKSGYKPETWISLAPQIDDTLRRRGTPYSNGEIDRVYANCTYNAGSAIVWSGADDDFPVVQGPPQMRAYMRSHKDKWEEVTGKDLMPGDVCVDERHIWISMSNCTKDGNVIDNKAIQDAWPGSTSARYDGAWQLFYPVLRPAPPTQTEHGGYAAFRFIGKVNEDSEFKKLKP